MGSFTTAAESETSYKAGASDSVPCHQKKKLAAAAVVVVEPIEPFASNALKLAVKYSLDGAERDGHWYGELKYACVISMIFLAFPAFPAFRFPLLPFLDSSVHSTQ